MLSSYAPAMRSHFFQETAARDFAAPHEPAGRAIIFEVRSGLARGPAISDQFSSRAKKSSSRARRRSMHLAIGDFDAPAAVWDIASACPFRDMSKVRGQTCHWPMV